LLLIDIAIPDDSDINTKETEKLSKYKDLEIEVSRMGKVRTKIVPIINGALDTITKELDQELQLPPHHPLATELQKITLMCTANIIRKVLG
jgi:glutamyl-tRNA reductase